MADLQSLAISLARAQGSCAGLQTALDILVAGEHTAEQAQSIGYALTAAKDQLKRAEDAWTRAVSVEASHA